MMRKGTMNLVFRSLFLLIGLSVSSLSQTAPPSTDIFLVDISKVQGALKFGTPVNVTNHPGYDNQPSFLPDGSGVLYTSLRNDPPGPQAPWGQAPTQTEIFRYDIGSKKTIRLTQTQESEYSANVMPGGKTFSVVRVEPDSTQRLWRFDMNGKNPAVVLREIKPVGYHAWADANKVALFVLGSPPTLQLVTVSTGKAELIAENIGRSLHKIPGKLAVSFVQKTSEKEWWITEGDIATRTLTPLVLTLAGREDYAWTPDGTLIMGNDSKLYSFIPGVSKEWKEIADFSNAKIKGIGRIAVSPSGNKLAFVALE
jgi:hypothetical protein